MPVDRIQLKDLFGQAIQIEDAQARAAFLDRECAGDANLRQRVGDLLSVHDRPAPALDEPLARVPAAEQTGAYASRRDADENRVGTVVAGKYKLLQQIGEGGMGTVWMADQTEPVKRRVAVKLIRVERGNSATILARFEAERQAIALMDHPHIARLLDAGTTDAGQPYFVMELVKGVPLTDYCDAHKLSVQHRLALFQQICSAVQHAHQKGIIHRDLKPTNILVESHDGKPVPKVIDFGLAKATSGLQLTEHSLFTAFGSVMGTPLYMAPEQATFNAIDVDTRADIYALGVILYELLTGTTPLTRDTAKKAALDEMLKLVREQEAPTPSSRLSSADALPSVAANRQSEPAKLGRFVRGELDWIVLKALSKERDRRYETANGFAKDIERFLNHEPVVAGPVGAGYKLRKFVQRNRGAVIAVSLVLVALLTGMVGTTLGLLEARRQEGIARAEAEAKELARKAEAEQRGIAQVNEGKALAAAEAEKTAKERESAQRAKAEKARDRTRDVLDAMTSAVTGDSLATQKVITEEQKKFLTEVLTYYKEFAGEQSDDERSRKRTAAAANKVGSIEFRLGHQEESATAFRMARDLYTALAADFPAVPKHRLDLSTSHNSLAVVFAGLGKRAEAEAELRQALAIQENLAADFPAVPEYHSDLAMSHNNLGVLLMEVGKRADAEGEYRKALAIQEKLAADFPAVLIYRQSLSASHLNLGNLLASLGKRAEAEGEYRQVLAIREKLAADFPAVPAYRQELARSHNNLGANLANLGKKADAEGEFRQALAIQEKLAADFPAVPAYRQELAGSHNNLGSLLAELGKRAEAGGEYRKALAILEKLAAEFPAVPAYRQDLAANHNNLGNQHAGLGKLAEAEEQSRKALAIHAKLAAEFPAAPAYRQELATSHNTLGGLLVGLGKQAEAVSEYRKALAIREKLAADFPAEPAYRQELAGSHDGLGDLLRDLGKQAEAEAESEIRKALAIREKLAADFPAVPANRQELARSYNNLGILLAVLGKQAEAESEFRKALAILAKLAADFPAMPAYRQELAGSHNNLGNLLDEIGKRAEAEAENRKALAIQEKLAADFPAVPAYRLELAGSHANLGYLLAGLGKRAEAEAEYRLALAIQEKLVAEYPAVPQYRAEFSQTSYNFARLCATISGKEADRKQEYADRAMELLQKAVQAGWKDAAHMKRDTDLDPLRERNDFKKLLAEVEATVEKK